MNIRQVTYGLIVGMIVLACGTTPKKAETVENVILQKLGKTKAKGILFGHQDDLAYGMQWSYVDGESDVKRVTGDYPAMFGWELGGIEEDRVVNLDSVPFDAIKRLTIWGHKQGGINTFSWHPFSPINSISSWNGDSVVVKHLIPGGSYHEQFKVQLDKVSVFLQELKDEKGKSIPFIFRPWHEMDGNWFWWGRNACTPEEVKALFRFTIEYLRKEKGLDQMLVAYSPDRNFDTKEEYLTWYPGDDVVDIVGMDDYWDFKQENGELDVIKKLHIVIETANQKGKLSALTETGCSNVTDSLWFTKKLSFVLNDSIISKELSYVMLWRNDPKVHFFFPYPGHPAAQDAKQFSQQANILLLRDFVGMTK
ncbi:glycoside hydrolase family 26 protein [Saccharicrinis fermentans]|uniref:Mannan endo-1,4-beta-mannosidase n=1 Tax=Saccharicrinis fermentans DSM 9555 = JCM 21142 TaxID=869213 RepID=W7XZL8_9BACT|nr:glycosyl hydrolase [Saccharicrinis fermentans]GAF04105.1 mannan endo-1,4-beta-mannosidase precursor [Saccharicrinis fermentans DSM 9555 = JCM 21142]